MRAEGGELPPEHAPFARRGGRWFVEELELAELAGELEGRPARVISRAAVDAVLAADGPRCLGLDALEDPELLALAAGAGWWARVRSRHELALAAGLGFPAERLVAAGPVVDDGFLKEALIARVAALELGAAERANARRIAAALDVPLPESDASPPASAGASTFGACGGFLAAVLAPPPDLQLDMPWPLGLEHLEPLASADSAPAWETSTPRPPLEAFAVGPAGDEAADDAGEPDPPRASGAPATAPDVGEPGADVQHVGLRFLSRDAGGPLPRTARLHGRVRRGDRVLLTGAVALARSWVDPVHEPVPGVLVRGRSWRMLAARPLPPREEGDG